MDFFKEIVNLSLFSVPVILAVIVIRLLFKKLPKIYSHVLWLIVLFRLVCPCTIYSPVGILPDKVAQEHAAYSPGYYAGGDSETIFEAVEAIPFVQSISKVWLPSPKVLK